MGLFNKSKEDKANKKEKSTIFLGDTLQPIGKIPINGACGLSLNPTEKVLCINHDKTTITLPYNRIKGFIVENETKLAKSGSGLGGAIVGGALFGGVGAVVGQNAKKGKTQTKWIALLTYEDKEGVLQTLNFVERGLTGLYSGSNKSYMSTSFEKIVNNIVSDYGEDITEL